MPDIVTLAMNPSIDVYTSVERVVPVHKLRGTAIRRDPGGGGVNVARVVRRFGADATAIYPVGGSIGQLLHKLVDAEDIRSVAVPIAEETREGFTVLEETSNQQYRFVLPGPAVGGHEWQRCLDALAGLEPPPRVVVASGSLPPGTPDDFYVRVARIAKQMGARLVVDTSGAPLKAVLTEGTYLIKPNLGELRRLLEAPLDDEASWLAACRGIVMRGGAEIVALTLGDQGALLATRDGAWRAQGVPVTLVSAVGAGDSFVGAMVWSLTCGHDLQTAFRYGVAAGTAALLTPGTELCRPDDVRRLVGEVSIRRL